MAFFVFHVTVYLRLNFFQKSTAMLVVVVPIATQRFSPQPTLVQMNRFPFFIIVVTLHLTTAGTIVCTVHVAFLPCIGATAFAPGIFRRTAFRTAFPRAHRVQFVVTLAQTFAGPGHTIQFFGKGRFVFVIEHVGTQTHVVAVPFGRNNTYVPCLERWMVVVVGMKVFEDVFRLPLRFIPNITDICVDPTLGGTVQIFHVVLHDIHFGIQGISFDLDTRNGFDFGHVHCIPLTDVAVPLLAHHCPITRPTTVT